MVGARGITNNCAYHYQPHEDARHRVILLNDGFYNEYSSARKLESGRPGSE